MVGHGELTEEASRIVAPLLLASRLGGQWGDRCMVINGLLQKRRTDAPWRDLLERYGSWQVYTCEGQTSSTV